MLSLRVLAMLLILVVGVLTAAILWAVPAFGCYVERFERSNQLKRQSEERTLRELDRGREYNISILRELMHTKHALDLKYHPNPDDVERRA